MNENLSSRVRVLLRSTLYGTVSHDLAELALFLNSFCFITFQKDHVDVCNFLVSDLTLYS